MSYQRQSIIFISNLDKNATETLLYQLFNEFPVTYIKIAKDHSTRESYGYAFVGFKNSSKAEEAIIKLNYSKVLKKSIRLSWYNRDPNNYRNIPEYNIFVKKIHKEVNAKEFHDYFSKFGNIVSAKLVEDDEGETVGCGFVLYDSVESARKAIEEGNGVEFHGKKIYVGQFIKNRPKKIPQFNTIYVKNLPKDYTKEQITKMFAEFGEVSDIFIKESDPKSLDKLPLEKKTHILNHQFAFITFKDFESSAKVINKVPYLKQNNESYNTELNKVVETIKKSSVVEEKHYYRFAAYLIELGGENDYKTILQDIDRLKETSDQFRAHILDNDDNYIVKDKADRIECCQALKKRERIKRLKALFEKIKKQIKEKYKYCNLYVKNLPDNFDDEQLRQLFGKFGQIRSVKACKKELVQSYIGIKRNVRVYGYVCYMEASQAREAKNALNNQSVFQNLGKLFVDYHQSKQERIEYLKLKMLSQNQKAFQKGLFVESPFPKMMPFGPGMSPFPMFGPQMLRKFPVQTSFIKPPNMIEYPPQNKIEDEGARKEMLGDQLYNKISLNPNYSGISHLFTKIVGIFLDLEEVVIHRLVTDDKFFASQVNDAVNLLNQSKSNA